MSELEQVVEVEQKEEVNYKLESLMIDHLTPMDDFDGTVLDFKSMLTAILNYYPDPVDFELESKLLRRQFRLRLFLDRLAFYKETHFGDDGTSYENLYKYFQDDVMRSLIDGDTPLGPSLISGGDSGQKKGDANQSANQKEEKDTNENDNNNQLVEQEKKTDEQSKLALEKNKYGDDDGTRLYFERVWSTVVSTALKKEEKESNDKNKGVAKGGGGNVELVPQQSITISADESELVQTQQEEEKEGDTGSGEGEKNWKRYVPPRLTQDKSREQFNAVFGNKLDAIEGLVKTFDAYAAQLKLQKKKKHSNKNDENDPIDPTISVNGHLTDEHKAVELAEIKDNENNDENEINDNDVQPPLEFWAAFERALGRFEHKHRMRMIRNGNKEITPILSQLPSNAAKAFFLIIGFVFALACFTQIAASAYTFMAGMWGGIGTLIAAKLGLGISLGWMIYAIPIALGICTFLCNLSFAENLYRSFLACLGVLAWYCLECLAAWNCRKRGEEEQRGGFYIVRLFVFGLFTVLSAISTGIIFYFITHGCALELAALPWFVGAPSVIFLVMGIVLGIAAFVVMLFITFKSLLTWIKALFCEKATKEQRRKKVIFVGGLLLVATCAPFLEMPLFAVSLSLVMEIAVASLFFIVAVVVIAHACKNYKMGVKEFLASLFKGVIFGLLCISLWSLGNCGIGYFTAIVPGVAHSVFILYAIKILFFLGSVPFLGSLSENGLKFFSDKVFGHPFFGVIAAYFKAVFKQGWIKGIVATLLGTIFVPITFVSYMINSLVFHLLRGADEKASDAHALSFSSSLKNFAAFMKWLTTDADWVTGLRRVFISFIKAIANLVLGVMSIIMFRAWKPGAVLKLIRYEMLEGEVKYGPLSYVGRFFRCLFRLTGSLITGAILLPLTSLWDIIYGFFLGSRKLFNAVGNAFITFVLALIVHHQLWYIALIILVAGIFLSRFSMGWNKLLLTILSCVWIVQVFSLYQMKYGERFFMPGAESLSACFTLLFFGGGGWRLLEDWWNRYVAHPWKNRFSKESPTKYEKPECYIKPIAAEDVQKPRIQEILFLNPNMVKQYKGKDDELNLGDKAHEYDEAAQVFYVPGR